MTDIIERAEATLEGISEAPWFAMDYDDNPGDEGVCLLSNHGGPRQRSFAYTGLGYSWISEDQAVADAEFIAAARDLVPGLIAELKAARAENERLQEDDLALAKHLTRAAIWMKRQYQDAGLAVVRAYCDAKGIDADKLERAARGDV